MDDAVNLSNVKSSVFGQSSPSRAGSPSPFKRGLSPALKMGGRDLNNTGMGLRSIGGSSDGRPNRSLTFLEPPIGGGLKRSPAKSVLKTGPTANNLIKLDNKSAGSRGILKSDAGNRTDRRMDGMSQRSKKSDKEPQLSKEET